jgi:hydrogenase maturation protein HypF
LRYVPLLGGDAAVREPLRMLASHLWAAAAGSAGRAQILERISVQQQGVWRHQFENGLNAPPTSSCGRLFDAVAVLLGLCEAARYEGEPAALLESVADPESSGSYAFEVAYEDDQVVVNVGPTFHGMLQSLACADPVPQIAMRFHNTVARFTAVTCGLVRGMTGITQVCLSGGCFQNALLLLRTRAELERRGFEVFTHARVPPNDGGIALGQAVVAAARAGFVEEQ